MFKNKGTDPFLVIQNNSYQACYLLKAVKLTKIYETMVLNPEQE